MADFAHLHVHTEFSTLDGAAKTAALFAEAERQGMPAIAMTDHGNMFGAYEFYANSANTSVKPIIGIEAYVAPSSRFSRVPEFWANDSRREAGDIDMEGGKDVSGGGRYTHMTMWAENATGLRNLFALSSIASFEGFYMKPRMDRESISSRAEGIIASTGCPSGEVQTRLRLGQMDRALQAASDYQDIFGKGSFFLELMDHGVDIEKVVRDDLLALGRKLNLPLLLTNDSHYVHEDEADIHDSLLCIGTGRNKDEAKRFRFNGSGYYLRTAAEMRSLMPDLPEAADNTLLLAERVGSYEDVFRYRNRMPQFSVPEGHDQESWLRHELAQGIAVRYGSTPSADVLERVETEMSVIGPMGYSSYFLIVADICRFARENGVPVGPGRGSAAGSLVSYLLQIIEIDPLRHGLLFERFLNPERVSPPDIDLDFDDRSRDKVIEYVTQKYGVAHTSQVNTFGTLKSKAAVKDASRILGFPFSMGEQITKAMPAPAMGKDVPLRKIFDETHPRYSEGAAFRELCASNADVRKVVQTATGLEGLIRNTGVHACAFIISSEPLVDIVPLHRRDKDGAIIAGFAYPQCEAMGLMKMDFLGLRNLGVIDHALRNIEANRGITLTVRDIPFDDPATYELLGRGETLGIFQLDGAGMRNLLRQLKPTVFDDITAAIALYRPGPMGANAHTAYAERKNGRQTPVPIHPDLKDALDPILGDTYHLIVYQEQIMAAARQLAGYTLGGADLLRRAMGKKKKEILDKEWVPFHAGMRTNGYSEESIKALWDVMVPFADYAFNKSHAAGYAYVSYWTAYLKANYPAEYAAALLTSVGDDRDKMSLYLADTRRMGVRVLPPDVNESLATFTAVDADVRFGLTAIRNVGANVVEGVVTARRDRGTFTSFEDFLRKSPAVVCNKRTTESLVKAGAFDSLGHPRQGLLYVHEAYVDALVEEKRAESMGQDSLFAGLVDDTSVGFVTLPPVPDTEWPKEARLTFEREMLGHFVSDHPLNGVEHILARAADLSSAGLLAEDGPADGATVTVAGLIAGLTRKVNKSGGTYAIASLEDFEGQVECMFFAKAYESYAHLLSDDTVAIMRGRVKRAEEGVKLFVTEVSVPDLSEGPRGPITIGMPLVRATEPMVGALKRVLSEHPGVTEVRVKLTQPGRSLLIALDDTLRVTASPALFGDLKALLGPNAILA